MALTREEVLALFERDSDGELEDFEVKGWGVFTLRPLSKYDQRTIRDGSLRKDGSLDTTALEIGLVMAGLVEPKLDADEVEQLSHHMTAGAYDAIVNRIAEISEYDLDQESVERRFPGSTSGPTPPVGAIADS